MSVKRIVLVEDDKVLAEAVSKYLSHEGYAMEVINDGAVAVSEIIAQQPDLVILDIMLPGKDGLTICKEVRPRYAGYILMFTAREDEIDQIVGLEIGADDYLIKPVKPRYLLAKIKAFLRRDPARQASAVPSVTLNFDDLTINLEERSVLLAGEAINLTSAEFDLLVILAQNAGMVMSRDEIMRHLSGNHYDGLDRTIDNKISLLRKKLGDDATAPFRIKTVRLKGYVLIPGAWVHRV
jgi:DNA-binding response OmpR family regulator